MTKIFRNCRYEIYTYTAPPNKKLWSRHHSLKSARRAYREAVNNHRGDHVAGTTVELVDILDGPSIVLERDVVRWQ